MAGRTSKQKDNTINIYSSPVQAHIGASKFMNDDWGTMAFVIPRDQIQLKFADQELRYNSIYFLFGYENNIEMCYVGQAKKRNNGESVLARLREHDESTTERYHDIWKWAVAVTNKNGTWTLDDLNALEHAFYAEIPFEQNLNGNTPNAGGADFDSYIDKIDQIKKLVTAIGFRVFAEKEETENIQVISKENDFTIVEDLQNGMARIPEIVTPHKVVKAMVDMLPSDVWNDQTVFLDPACKGGEYLREIYDRLMDNEVMQSKYPNDIERSNHILKNQIYGIALSQVSLERTAKKLMGFDMNIKVIPRYIDILKAKFDKEVSDADKREYIMGILNKEFGKTMKIDVVIGNPPYQEINGGGGKAIYDTFIYNGIKIAKYTLMITSNTWLKSEVLGDLRNTILNSGIRSIINYSKLGDIFKGVGVSVSIVFIDKDYNGETLYKEIIDNQCVEQYSANLKDNDITIIPSSMVILSILNKTKCKQAFNNMMEAKLPFGIESSGKIGTSSDSEIIETSMIETEDYNVPIMFMDGTDPVYYYTSIDEIPKNKELVNEYGVLCGRVLNRNKNVITNIQALNKGHACSGSYAMIYHSEKKDEAFGAYKYTKTQFVRFLIYINLSDYNRVTPYRFSLVPLQDFTNNSDIDWSQSIADIDKQLYKKYNLSDEEIAYIEKTIKPMN